MVVGQANNNENPKPDSGGRHINRTLGEENRLELLVRRPTTANRRGERSKKALKTPPPAGDILIANFKIM